MTRTKNISSHRAGVVTKMWFTWRDVGPKRKNRRSLYSTWIVWSIQLEKGLSYKVLYTPTHAFVCSVQDSPVLVCRSAARQVCTSKRSRSVRTEARPALESAHTLRSRYDFEPARLRPAHRKTNAAARRSTDSSQPLRRPGWGRRSTVRVRHLGYGTCTHRLPRDAHSP